MSGRFNMKGILIACIGNMFYGDDAFGVEVGKRLFAADLPKNVKVVDFGISGVDLAFELSAGYELAILVDTIKLGAEAGTLFVLEPKTGSFAGGNAHDVTPAKALEMAAQLDNPPKKMLLIGCEPANLEFNSEMREPVKRAIEKAAAKIEELIGQA